MPRLPGSRPEPEPESTFSDNVRGKAQLKIKDAFEDGRLQKVAVNPDGSTYAYRIINPRQFIRWVNSAL